MIEVRRPDDGELCGHVLAADDGSWRSLTVFGAELAEHSTRADLAAGAGLQLDVEGAP